MHCWCGTVGSCVHLCGGSRLLDDTLCWPWKPPPMIHTLCLSARHIPLCACDDSFAIKLRSLWEGWYGSNVTREPPPHLSLNKLNPHGACRQLGSVCRPPPSRASSASAGTCPPGVYLPREYTSDVLMHSGPGTHPPRSEAVPCVQRVASSNPREMFPSKALKPQ